MTSRWLDIGQVFFFAFLWTETKSRSKKNAKKKRDQYPTILTEKAWSTKDLLYGQKITSKNFAFAGAKREIWTGQDRPILPSPYRKMHSCKNS